jgi:segregation and condensation protein B
MGDIHIQNNIEALLFYKAEDMKISDIAKILDLPIEQIKEEVSNLKENLNSRGLNIVEKEDSVMLVTSTESSDIIKKLQKEELEKDLSKAALETLSIIIYRGPIKRSEIDYIRGVNSQFILRLLLIRGLIEKVTNPKDERGFLYKPSFDLLNTLGIDSIKKMPEYDKVNEDIENYISAEENENQG